MGATRCSIRCVDDRPCQVIACRGIRLVGGKRCGLGDFSEVVGSGVEGRQVARLLHAAS